VLITVITALQFPNLRMWTLVQSVPQTRDQEMTAIQCV